MGLLSALLSTSELDDKIYKLLLSFALLFYGEVKHIKIKPQLLKFCFFRVRDNWRFSLK